MLKKVLAESKTDSEVTLRVWRQGEEMDRKVYLASMSDKLPKGHDAWLGVMLAAADNWCFGESHCFSTLPKTVNWRKAM